MSVVSEDPPPSPVVSSAPARTSNLTQKAGLNAFSYLVDFTARTAVMLLVTPFILHGLGKPLFGVWQVLLKTVNYLQTADGRPTDALKWTVAREQSNSDHGPKREAIGSAIGVFLLFLPLLLTIGLGLVIAFPYFTDVKPQYVTSVRIACALLVLNFVAIGLVNLPEAVLEGMNLRYRRMFARTFITILGGFLSAGFIYLGLGLPGLALAQVLLSLSTAYLALTIVRKNFKWYGFVKPTWEGTKRFVRLTTTYIGSSLVGRMIVTCDVVTLGIVATSSVVTVYVLSSYAANVLIYVIPAMLNSAVPGLGKILGEKRHDRVIEIRSEMMTLGWLVMASTGATILAWNRSFIHLWVGLDNYAGALGDIMIILLTTQYVFIQGDSAVVDATLKVKMKAKLGLLATALGIGLAALLIPRYGINGLCAGLIVGRSLLSFGYPMIIRKNLGMSTNLSYASGLRPVTVMLLVYGVFSLFGQRVLAHNWFFWLAGVVPTFVVAFVVCFALGLPDFRRRMVMARIRRLAGRRA